MPSTQQPFIAETPSRINWNLILVIAVGVIIIATLVTVFFVIPKVVEESLNNQVQGSFSGLNLGLG